MSRNNKSIRPVGGGLTMKNLLSAARRSVYHRSRGSALYKTVSFVLYDKTNAILPNTTVQYAIGSYGNGDPAQTGWMVIEAVGTATTDESGLLTLIYQGVQLVGDLVYVIVFQPNSAPTESLAWTYTVTQIAQG